MGNSKSEYSCGACGKKVDLVDRHIKRNCLCSAKTKVLANMTVRLKYRGSRGEYFQLLESGRVFYTAAILLKKNGYSSIVYINLICQAFENISKYLICESKGYRYCYPDSKKLSGKFGHRLNDIVKELKENAKYKVCITKKLEKEIEALVTLYVNRKFIYGDFQTFFTSGSQYKTTAIMTFLRQLLAKKEMIER